MKTQKFSIIRLAGKSRRFKTGADIEILKNWHAVSLYTALRLCEIARATYGGEWVPAHNGADTVTVWVGYSAREFAPSQHRNTGRRVA